MLPAVHMLSWNQVGRWILGGSTALLGGWSATVAYERSKELPPERSSFRPGSADDVLLDALETGDLESLAPDPHHQLRASVPREECVATASGTRSCSQFAVTCGFGPPP